jgi:Na+-transporting NADH:ubiquinone oxidoreductase subunit NqrB
MMALIIIETPKITEIIFCVIISTIGFYNIAFGIAETVVIQKEFLSDSSSI